LDTDVLFQLFILFALIITGYIINKLKIIDEHTNGTLSAFLLKVTLPCAIIDSAMNQEAVAKTLVAKILLIAVGIFIVMTLLSKAVTKVFRMEKTYQLMLNYSNLGFMGFPVIASLYGTQYVFYAALFIMIFNVHIFTVGVMTLQGKMGGFKQVIKKLCTPGVICALIAVVIVFFPTDYPQPLLDFTGLLGGITSPLAMVVIGSSLAEVKIRDSFNNWQLYVMTAFKLIVYPALVYLVLFFIMGPCIEMKVATVLIGMPVAANVTMLSSVYGGNVSLAAEGTCISTILSLGTLPLMMMLMG
jgi:predicted permease